MACPMLKCAACCHAPRVGSNGMPLAAWLACGQAPELELMDAQPLRVCNVHRQPVLGPMACPSLQVWQVPMFCMSGMFPGTHLVRANGVPKFCESLQIAEGHAGAAVEEPDEGRAAHVGCPESSAQLLQRLQHRGGAGHEVLLLLGQNLEEGCSLCRAC